MKKFLCGRTAVLALAVCWSVANAPSPCQAGFVAMASVNGNAIGGPSAQNTTSGKGVSMAGAKVFHPVKEDYQVSGPHGSQAANAAETAAMQGLIPVAQNLADHLLNNKNLSPNEQAAANTKANQDFRDAADKLRPNAGNFAEQDKKVGQTLTAKTQLLENSSAFEQARGEASQTLRADKTVNYITNPTTTVKPGDAKKPMATAFAINRDPLAVGWSSGPREVTLDLSAVRLSLQTGGLDSVAAGVDNYDGKFVNGTLDLNTPEPSSPNLYSLALGVFGSEGQTPMLLASLDTFGNAVRDNLGDVGAQAVETALASNFQSLGGGQFGFSSDYSLTFGVPDMPTQSVLYLNEYSATSAETTSTPAPPGFALGCVGALTVGGWVGWRQRKQAAVAC